ETQAIVFVVLAFALLAMSALAILRVGLMRLESRIGIFRDGLAPGTPAPSWGLADGDGNVHVSPSGRVQLLIFADHSLREFREAAAELAAIHEDQQAEVIVLTKSMYSVVVEVMRALGLHAPVVRVEPELYRAYNVRVIPFAFVISPQGVVCGSGLANSKEAVRSICDLAGESGVLTPDSQLAT
ncbi:MAG TPA: hypothetical protein VGQ84_00200, partial [Gaiellaceae bacterium]|nr:hypothetical protein [Gaiellaceae bacterium]